MNTASFLHRSIQRLLLLCVILATLIPVAGVSAQPAGDDRVDAVTAAAIEMSRQREGRELYELYDGLHPDARNVFPRQALLAWAESGELGYPVDDPEIGEVTFGDWTWDVTGEVFDEAATVSYTQDIERNGSTEEARGEWTFVHDGERWRWFPDLPASELERLTEEVRTEPETYNPTFRRAAYVRIDRFWEDIFTGTGLDYTPMADIVAVTYEPFETGCGIEEEIDLYAIYYCTLDETVYYDPDFQEQVVDAIGPYGFTTIIAHEWGHHVQSLLGIDISRNPDLDDGLYPIDIELQADCLAGVYAQDALAMGDIDQDEIDAAILITSLSGDTSGADPDEADAHGNAAQRVTAFFAGFENGFAGCDIDLDDYAA